MAPSITGEIADTLVSILESAPVQAELVAAISAGEVTLENFSGQVLDNIKVGGILGVVVNATKGSIEAELKAAISHFTPEQFAAWLTKQAQDEAKALGG